MSEEARVPGSIVRGVRSRCREAEDGVSGVRSSWLVTP